MTGDKLTLGLFQHAGSPEGMQANLAILEDAAARAANRGIDLLVFPECFLTGYWRTDGLDRIAGDVDDRVIGRIEACARKIGVALVVGSYQRSEHAVHNTALAVTPRDGCVARYAKRALYGEWERRVFAPGVGPVLFRYCGFDIGLLICFDVEFPELVRTLARRGADLVVVPTALMEPYAYIADFVVPARAIENQIFVAYANRIGEEGPFHYVGRSRICGPLGPITTATAADDPVLVEAVLEKSALSESRAQSNYLEEIPADP